MNHWCHAIAAGCALGLFAPAAQAQKAPASPPAATEAAWKMICPQAPAPAAGASAPAAPAPACGLVQNLVAGEQKQRLLTLIVKRITPSAYGLTIALPHGLLFPAGIALQVDETPERTLAVQTSDQNGAYTGTAIDAELLKALQAGKTLKVKFTGGTGQRIVVPVTLKDFAPGIVALGKTPLPPAPPATAPGTKKP